MGRCCLPLWGAAIEPATLAEIAAARSPLPPGGTHALLKIAGWMCINGVLAIVVSDVEVDGEAGKALG
jgi:hypothetical protein